MKALLGYVNADAGREHWRRGRIAARKYLDALDTRDLEEWLVSTWGDDLRNDRSPSDAPAPPASVRDPLPQALLDAMEDKQGDPIGFEAFSIVKARVIARILAASPPSYAPIRLCSVVAERSDWGVLCDRFPAALDDRQSTAWIEALRDMPQDPNDYVLGHTPGERNGLVEQGRRWKLERLADTRSWAHNHIYAPARSAGPFLGLALLRRLDPVAWLRAVDNLPLSSITETALKRDGDDQDPVALLGLLAVAPPVVSKDLAETGSIVARVLSTWALELGLAVRDGLETKARSTLDSERSEVDRWRKVADTVLPDWYENVAVTIGARADGQQLLVDLGCDFLHRASQRRPWEQDSTGDKEAGRAADALTRELAKSAESRIFVYQAWQRRERVSRRRDDDQDIVGLLAADGIPYWVLAAVTEFDKLGARPGAIPLPRADALELWRWLRELLNGQDPAIDAYAANHGPGQITMTACGLVLASTGDAQPTWHSAWRELEEQRYAALATRESQRSSWSPSRFVATAALHATQFMRLASFSDEQHVPALWTQVFRATLYLALRSNDWDGLIDALGWFAVLYDGGTGAFAAATATAVSDAAGYLVGEVQVATRAALMLYSNGYPVADLDAAFLAANIDIVAYAQEAKDSLPAKRLNPEPIAKLVTALEASRQQTGIGAPPPP